jgi:hypothetical protein
MDNSAIHETPAVRNRLARRPRRRVHLTPTSSSWVDQVERFFPGTEKQRRRSVHRSACEREAAIRAYIDAVNNDPKPLRWTKPADNSSPASNAPAWPPSKPPKLGVRSNELLNRDTRQFAISGPLRQTTSSAGGRLLSSAGAVANVVEFRGWRSLWKRRCKSLPR